MMQSYLTAAARNFKKNKLHTLINVTGLSLGIMTSLLAFMFVLDEISFDNFHKNRDRIYRLNKINTEEDGSKILTAETSGMMGPTMAEEFPEVEKAVRYLPWFSDIMLINQDRSFLIPEGELVFTDNTFLEIFDFKLLRGDVASALTRPQTIVLTSRVAISLFGSEDPIGKVITGINGILFEVTGIIEPAPRNSHIQFAGLMSYSSTTPNLGQVNMEWMNNWIAQGITTFLLLRDHASAEDLEKKFKAFMQVHMPTRVDKYQLYLQPFRDVYLKSTNIMGTKMSKSGSRQFVLLFSIIAGFILLIACINYVNISTSKATRRSREVGMRKTMGATKHQLWHQFLGESVLLTSLASFLAAGLLFQVIPLFNNLAGRDLPITLLFDRTILFGLVGLVLFVGIVSGLYPAAVLSSFNPSDVLRGAAMNRLTGHWPRYVLITFQFTVSIAIITGTLVVFQQIRFVLSKDLGFDQEHILVLNLPDGIYSKRDAFQTDVNGMAGVVSTSLGRTALGHGGASTYVIPEGFKPDEVEIRMFPVDGNFQKTYDLQMEQGRFFDITLATDSSSLIINEAMAKRLNWKEPLNKTIRFSEGQPALPVIGVMKDFHYASLYSEVEPIVMWLSARNLRNLSIRFTGNPAPLLATLETKWKTYESHYPFEFYFLNEAFAKSYATEQKLLETVATFSGLSIFIACLGLYGLVSYTIEQRSKEFGIRKVLGASVTGLNFMVNRKFILMVMISAVVALPIVVPFAQDWLAKFAFHTPLTPLPFVASVLITLIVTISAGSIHAIRAAMANPAQSLRNE